jgi:hypothetical protein
MVLEHFQIDLDQDKLMRLLGARNARHASRNAVRRIDNLAKGFEALVQPRLAYRMIPIDSITSGKITLADGACFKSPKLARTFSGADRACCFIATIGPQLDAEVVRRMKSNHYADAYILDAMGSLAAEQVVEQFHGRMEMQMEQDGHAVTLRFSPGYCDWPIDQQQNLFELFENIEDLDVNLSASCLMTPRKSVSGVFGIVPDTECRGSVNFNPCLNCPKRDCIARRIPNETGKSRHT